MKFFLYMLSIVGTLNLIGQTIATPTILEVDEDDRIATIYWNSLNSTYVYPWDNFKNTGSMSYKIEWGEVAEGFTQQLYTPYRAIQLQPLNPGTVYQAKITAIDAFGRISSPSATVQFQHNSSRVDSMRTRLNGFFDDFNQTMGAFDELKWNQSYSGCAKIGYGSQHINSQFHAHNVVASDACDRGFASSRARKAFDYTNRTGRIEFDLDGSKISRQRWYLDISPASRKRDLTGLTPIDSYNENYVLDSYTKRSDPPFLLRINEFHDNIYIQMVDSNGVLVDVPNILMNGACGQNMPYCPNKNMIPIPNVRKHWVIELSKTHIKIFIDDILMIDGSLVNSITPNGLPYEEAQLNWIWFSYNTTKENMPLSMVHWDNFGFDAPQNAPDNFQIHNYTDGILGTENDPIVNDPSHGLMSTNSTPALVSIPIPDQILDTNGNQPVSAELMFSIQGNDYNWTLNDIIKVNGNLYPFAEPTSEIVNLPQDQFISTNQPYSALVALDPMDLVSGNNAIEFYLNNPKLLNIHIELTYPKISAPSYTQPVQVHSNHMSKLMQFNQYNSIGANLFLKDINGTYYYDTNEYVYTEDSLSLARFMAKQTPIVNELSFDVYCNSDAQLAAKAVASGIAYYEIWIDQKVYHTVSVAAQEYPSYFVHEDVKVNTTQLSNGLHEFFIVAYDIYGRPSVFDVTGHIGFGEYFPTLLTINNTSNTPCSTNLFDGDLGGGNGSIILPGAYYAANEVVSTGKVDLGNSITFSAGSQVLLTQGFEVVKGGFFIAGNWGCFE